MAYPSVIDWKMKEIESKGVASDQINGGSLMRFVKQRRSRSLGVQSRLSNLGLRGDRYYWSEVLLGKKKNPPFVPLIPEIRLFHLFYLAYFTYFTEKKYTHTPTQAAALHPEWMSFSQISVLFVLCPFTQTGPQSLSPSLSFILCAHNLNRWSPFDSVLFLPLSLWASASSYLPFYPQVPWHPFYPVLAATLSLFASHSAGCCSQHMTLPRTEQQRHKGWFKGLRVFYLGSTKTSF